MSPVFWAAILLLVGLVLVMAEIFVPSGGLIGFLSFSSIVAAIFLAFYEGGPSVGVVFLLISCVGVPAALIAAFRYLPDTPMGKKLLASIPSTHEVMPDNEQRRRLRELVGRVGRAKSKMLPSGAVLVDGQLIDAVSEGMPIELDQPVRVMEVRGAMVVVRAVSENAIDKQSEPEDVLSRPIDSLGFDPFQDPLV